MAGRPIPFSPQSGVIAGMNLVAVQTVICGEFRRNIHGRIAMKSRAIAVACSLALFSLVAASPGHAQSRMKACADEWKTMKAANQTAGKKYRDFQKECLARSAAAPGAAAPGASTATGPVVTPAGEAKATKGGGREAARARQRACGEEWKADKAAGKVAAGMTWPKYWSECNKRKKAAGT
jgi:hypothetical protein